MTRLFTDGFELGDNLLFSNTAYGPVISTTQARSGIYSFLLSGTLQTATISFAANNEYYIRFGYYPEGNANVNFLAWRYDSTTLGGLYRTGTTGMIGIFVTENDTIVATSSYPAIVDQWNLIELHIKISDTVGLIELKINGILDPTATYSGDTKPGKPEGINNIILLSVNLGTFYIDDIAINDTAGAVDNSWCGDGHVIALTPNANGDSSQLLGSDADSTDNYLLVDEVPSDGDTTYVESATADEQDLYNLTPCGLVDKTVLRVWAEARVKDTTTGDGTVKLLVKTEATEYESANIDLSTSYAAHQGTVYAVNPNTSAAWTTAQLDALQVGMKIVD